MNDDNGTMRVPAKILAHLLFWGWNAVFLVLTLFGVVPFVGVALLRDTVSGLVPLSLTAALVSVVVVPMAVTALGAARLRRDPARLFELLYAVELPLFLLAIGRLFFVRDLTAGVGFVIVATFVAVAAYLHDLVRRRDGTSAASLAGSTVGLMVALYAAVLLAFLAIPTAGFLLREFFRLKWLEAIGELLQRGPFAATIIALWLSLFLLSATLFAAAPPVLITLFVRRFLHQLRGARAVMGVRRAALVVVGVAAALALGFLLGVRQPQHAALAMLASPPADDAARRARLGSADTLCAGLLNAYVAPWRYLGSTANDTGIGDLWRHSLDIGHDRARSVQGAFDFVARPFVFEGDASEAERRRAGELYAGFFDRSIQRGERASIVSALEATYSREDREAGLLAQGERKVHVTRQEVRLISERGAQAEIEIHEVYANQTFDPQEVLYFFSLPETAAITGLWLGETDRREDAFAFTVSPRGAAQRVYRAQVAQRRDPALLEQVGPRQYRLRAFPIPARDRPRGGARDITAAPVAGRPMHLWLRYRTLAEGDRWPLPSLVEQRNAYRDRRTERVADGITAKLLPDVWLPPSLPQTTPARPAELTARLDDKTVIVARPAPEPTALPHDGRYVVVLDRSYSMGAHADRVTAALGWIRQNIEPRNDVDLFLTSAPSRGEPARWVHDPREIDPASIVYYGGQDPADLLVDLDLLRGDTRYGGIIVLTDEGGFDLAGAKRPERDLGAAVWMVHLGGVLAPGYDDTTLAAIQRWGGGVTTKVDTAFTRLAETSRDPSDLGWADGYRWSVQESAEGPFDAGFTAIAAHRWIPFAAKAQGLDAVHRIARDAAVVTPFSSMIVLVDDAQRKALAEAEASANRFERDTETGEARLNAPSSALGGDLTGTPEPEEWMLMGIAGLALVWMARRRARFAPVPA